MLGLKQLLVRSMRACGACQYIWLGLVYCIGTMTHLVIHGNLIGRAGSGREYSAGFAASPEHYSDDITVSEYNGCVCAVSRRCC